jgi:epidermal growth factor receptor substrate 15
MYFIQASMSGAISSIPTTLPPGVYEQASGGKSLEFVTSHSTGGSIGSPGLGGNFPSNSSLHPQLTGTPPIKPQYTGSSILKPVYTGGNFSATPTAPSRLSMVSTTSSAFEASQRSGGWDVRPEEKANFDRFFDTLDTQRRGFIEGDVAVPFMLQSSLQEGDLAQIWSVFLLLGDKPALRPLLGIWLT